MLDEYKHPDPYIRALPALLPAHAQMPPQAMYTTQPGKIMSCLEGFGPPVRLPLRGIQAGAAGYPWQPISQGAARSLMAPGWDQLSPEHTARARGAAPLPTCPSYFRPP